MIKIQYVMMVVNRMSNRTKHELMVEVVGDTDCNHEFRQLLENGYSSMHHGGYYCIYCLRIVNWEEVIEKNKSKR